MTSCIHLSAKCDNSGFTLVEMAMVITIIGLIVGAVLVGRDMIHAAELRSIYKTVQQFQTAINVFRDKYNGLPGDLRNATNFLSCTKVATNFVGGFNASCNGDGNGLINAWPTGGNTWEGVIALEHLYKTGIIAENWDNTSGDHVVNQTVRVRVAYDAQLGFPWSGNSIMLLGQVAYAQRNVGALSAKDAYNLEKKYDDGISNSGRIRAVRDSGIGTKCTGVAVNYTGASDWTTEDTSCVVDFPF